MLKNIFVSILFLSTTLAVASQEIGDVQGYISDIESKLNCSNLLSGQSIVKDAEGRDVEVLYFCQDDQPEMKEARVFNEKGFTGIDIAKTSFGENLFTVREKYYTYYDNSFTKSTVEHLNKYYPKTGSIEKMYSMYDYFSEDRRITKSVKIQPSRTAEESWEYFNDGVRSKYSVIVSTANEKTETVVIYNQVGEKINDTEIYYDVENGAPYKRSITEYELKSQKILKVVVFDYEDGVEVLKTVFTYEKGKLVLKTYYELIYDAQGKLVREKKIGKETF